MGKEQNQQIREYLLKHAEEKYADFSAGLIPGAGKVMGIRLPQLRALAKQLAKGDWRDYLEHAEDHCMEETMLQGMTLGYIREPFAVISPYLDRFVPKIDNWSVCDSACTTLKIAEKEPEEVRKYLQIFLESEAEFQIRFGVVMLLDHYLKPEYINDVLQQLDAVCHPGYYVKMAVAWNLSVCYVRFPEKTMAFLKSNHLDDWTHNKAIQKIMESHRVSADDKAVLRNMKR